MAEAYIVAAGRVDAFTTLQISPWDVAAGALCVEEAGGKVTDLQGQPWRLQKTDMLMSNGHLHSELLDEIQFSGVPSFVDSPAPDSSAFTETPVDCVSST